MNSNPEINVRNLNKRSTFGQQLVALVKRNVLLKRRNRGRTLLEISFPIYMILVIIAIKSSVKPKTSDAIDRPEGYGTNWFLQINSYVFPDFTDKQWFIVSENNSKEIEDNIKNVLKKVNYPNNENIIFNDTFKTSDEIENFYILNKDNISFALIFDTKNVSNISYTIRMPYNSVPNVFNTMGSIGNCGENPFANSCDEMKYFRSGFSFIQTVVDSALIRFLSGDVLNETIPVAPLLIFPKPQYTPDTTLWQSLVPTYLAWAFMPSVSILTIMFVLEKERKIKEGMLVMGLKVSAYWIGWILVQSILVLFLSLIMTFILYFASIIEGINPLILFILMVLFGISMIGVSALISPFFKKEKAAGSFVSFFTLIAGLVHLLVVFLDISPSVYYLLSLISPVAFTLAINSITLRTSGLNTHIGFSNLFDDPVFSVGSAILMLIADCVLYSLLAIYLDQVIPGDYGSKQPVLFFLKKSYWVSYKPKEMTKPMTENSNSEHNSDVEEISFEMRGKLAISIENLTKVYGKGKKAVNAVNDLSFTIYESQITGLLGHNGAGKSTLINMLIGNIAPTSGTAYIYGHNISNPIEMNNLRQMFGVCLQQDILFDELNCVEHLNFFAQIKGIESQRIDSEVKRLLTEVQLFDDRLTPSKKLSGGQKRKLSVAIALIGNPKIILLDEPSSGVDPYSRRQLWSLFQSYKKDRVIILSTHFMDEADVLADRKAIIANGKLRCVGSSMFLKNRFGIGYHLVVDIKKGTDVDVVNELIQSTIPNAKFERFTTSEVFYILPPTETQLFPQLFDALEVNISKNDSFIKSFGISMTTLEEVFLKIGDEVETESQNNKKQYTTNDSESIGLESLMSSVTELKPTFTQSFCAFLYLRILIFIRNPMHTIPIIVLPIIMILISYFLMNTSNIKNLKPNPLLLNPTIYSQNKTTLLYKNSTNDRIDEFLSSVDTLGVTTESINNFSLESMSDGYMAVNISSFGTDIGWDFLFNDTYIHSLPILQNLMSNFYTNFLNSHQSQSPVNTYSHPFPQTNEENILYAFDGKVYTYVILMAIMLSSIPPSIAVEVVEDRESKIKNLLRVCGLSFKVYWITTLVCHLIMFSISILLVLIATIFLMDLEFLQNSEAVICVCILFILFMPSSLIACYVWTHMFNKKDTARSILPILCYLPGMIMIIFVSIISAANPSTGRLLHIIFCFIWPFYVPQGALLWIANTSNMIKIYSITNYTQSISYFDWNQNIVICFIALIFHIIFYTILLVFFDKLKSGESISSVLGLKSSDKLNCLVPSDEEDDDVRQERVDVEHYLSNPIQTNTPIVLLNDLQKKYSKNNILNITRKSGHLAKTAIQNMSLLLESGHIFGLLGPNGAGKTTTIKIMICEEKQTNGTVLINGHKVNSSNSKVFELMGYCPQHDSLWKEITLKEHMQLFAAIRGIPRNQIETITSNYIKSMRIDEHSNKRTDQLSGGTKRKLCYLMSLLGRPKLVLLDEPSTGLDPKAKRFLWRSIESAFGRNSNRSAILTTHSMEETDALCTRLAIVVKGVMRCIGSVQHLKNKYGAGYVLEIKWIQTNESINGKELKQLIESFFTEVIVKEEYNNRLIFDIPQHSVESLSRIFGFLENLRKTMSAIEEYCFSQKTIEQVFIDLAKEQEINEE